MVHESHLGHEPGLRHHPEHRSALLRPVNNPAGYKYASNNDQVKLWQEFDLTLWYRPIEAIKFGLQYAYERTDFLQKLNNPVQLRRRLRGVSQAQGQPNAGAKDFGESHRVQFVALMFF